MVVNSQEASSIRESHSETEDLDDGRVKELEDEVEKMRL